MEACRFRLLSLQRRSSYSFRRFATPPPTFPDGKMEREVLFERGSRFIGRIPLLLSRGTRRVYLLLGGLRPTTSKALSFRIPLVPSLFSSFPFFSSLLLFFLFFFFSSPWPWRYNPRNPENRIYRNLLFLSFRWLEFDRGKFGQRIEEVNKEGKKIDESVFNDF